MGAGAAAAPGGGTGRARSRLRGWLHSAGAAEDGASGETLEQLEREVTLLREENARLKVARERADPPVNERVRAMLSSPGGEDSLDADEPWEILTECMLLRDGLVDACRELERGARELRGRLETLLPNTEGEGRAERASDDFEGVA
jgi:hypothetical protein